MVIDENTNRTKLPISQLALAMEAAHVTSKSEVRKSTLQNAPFSKIPMQLCFEKLADNSIRFIGEYMEIYIDESDIERNTELDGQKVHTIGIFEMHIWTKAGVQNIADTKPTYVTRFMLPMMITTIPSSISKKTMSLQGEPEMKYCVLGFQKNSVFIENTMLMKNAKTVEKFMKMIMGGFVPNCVRYDEFVSLLIDCCILNGMDIPVSATAMELLIAAQCRSKEDLYTPYRMIVNKTGQISTEDMKLIKMTQVPQVSSTFGAIAFQDITQAVTVGINNHRKHKKEADSPIEDVLKY